MLAGGHHEAGLGVGRFACGGTQKVCVRRRVVRYVVHKSNGIARAGVSDLRLVRFRVARHDGRCDVDQWTVQLQPLDCTVSEKGKRL